MLAGRGSRLALLQIKLNYVFNVRCSNTLLVVKTQTHAYKSS
jgi:hypothetical protein